MFETTKNNIVEVDLEKQAIIIDNIESKMLLEKLPYSEIYLAQINNTTYVYKVIYQNNNMDFNKVFKSYSTLSCFSDLDELVQVYDYRKAEDNSTFEVLMEHLADYAFVESIEDKGSKYDHAYQIYKAYHKFLDKGLVPIDSGLPNFLTNGKNIKIIDLDLFLNYKEINFFQTNWFIDKINEIVNWCPEIEEYLTAVIKRVVTERAKYFLTHDPRSQKLIDDAEKILSEETDLNKAKELIENALDLTPNFADAHNDYAVVHWLLGDTARAEEELKTALDIEPDNHVFVMNYLDVLIGQKKLKEANDVQHNYSVYISCKDAPEILANIAQEDKSNFDELQKEIEKYSYPANYAYDIRTLKPIGKLVVRVDYLTKYTPELFEPCEQFLSVGSSLGYMMFFHAENAKKCVGIEPDKRANEIVKNVMKFRGVENIFLHQGTFKDFSKNEKYDLIWMGNVFQYMYVDLGWDVAKQLAEISIGNCIIEAPLEGIYLQQQAHLNANWKNEELMNAYSLERFKEELGKYFTIDSVNPSGTDPVNRVLVSLTRK